MGPHRGDQRLPAARARRGRHAVAPHRSPRRLRSRQSLHRGDSVRRARRDPRPAARARRVSVHGRPVRLGARHVRGRPHRLPLRDQRGRRPQRRAHHGHRRTRRRWRGRRVRRRQPLVGRNLGGAHRAPSRRVVRGDPDPLPHAELRPERRELGDQLPALDPAQQRRDPVARLRAERGPEPPRVRGRTGGTRRSLAGDRPGGGGLGHRQLAQHPRQRGPDDVPARREPRPQLQRDAEPARLLQRQHGFRRGGERPAPRQPHALPAALPGAARLLSRGFERVHVRPPQRPAALLLAADRDRGRPADPHRLRASPHGPAQRRRPRLLPDGHGRPLVRPGG